MSYQAVAFDGGGSPVVSATVGVQISILDNSATGTAVYVETHTPTTNAQGVFNLVIGQGSPVTGTFEAINWAVNSKFLKVELDPAGGTSYTSVGTNQLMSVPYALFAEGINNSKLNFEEVTTNDGKSIVIYTDTYAYVTQMAGGLSNSWLSTSISGTVQGSATYNVTGINALVDNNTILYTNTNAYMVSSTYRAGHTPTWISTSLSGSPIGHTSNGIIYTDTHAYKAHYNSGTSSYEWLSTPLSGTVLGAKGSFVYTSSHVYCHNNHINNWASTTISGTPQGVVSFDKGGIFYTDTHTYAFGGDGGGDTWNIITLSGTVQGTVTD